MRVSLHPPRTPTDPTTGSAYIFTECFNEFVYSPPADSIAPSQQAEDLVHEPRSGANTAFEIPLSALVECLNVFGTATAKDTDKKTRRWRHIGSGSDEEQQNQGDGGARQRQRDAPAGNDRIDRWFGNEKGTAMRVSYAGAGHPLTFTM